MNKEKIYRLLAIGLLVSNLLLIGFILWGKPKPPIPRDLIIEKLHFDAAQTSTYDSLITRHQEAIKENDETLRTAKKELYHQLHSSVSNSEKELLLQTIAETQAAIEAIHFEHFEDIKALCTAEQLEAFDGLSDELVKLFAPPALKKDRP